MDCKVTLLDDKQLKLVSVVKGSHNNDYITNISFEISPSVSMLYVDAQLESTVSIFLATILNYLSSTKEAPNPENEFPNYLNS